MKKAWKALQKLMRSNNLTGCKLKALHIDAFQLQAKVHPIFLKVDRQTEMRFVEIED